MVGANIIVSTSFFETVAPCRVQISDFKRPINPYGNISFISLQKCMDNHAGTQKTRVKNSQVSLQKQQNRLISAPVFSKKIKEIKRIQTP